MEKTAYLNGEPHVARLILRDLINALVELCAGETASDLSAVTAITGRVGRG